MNLITSDTEDEVEDINGDTETVSLIPFYLISTAIWGTIGYGGGYLIGYLLDDWETVYFGNIK